MELEVFDVIDGDVVEAPHLRVRVLDAAGSECSPIRFYGIQHFDDLVDLILMRSATLTVPLFTTTFVADATPPVPEGRHRERRTDPRD